MKNTDALLLVMVMGGVIFLCRALPFLLFRENKNNDGVIEKSKGQKTFLSFVEKIVPPVAMTVLAFNFMTSPIKENPQDGITIFAASGITALIYLLRRNPLLSIFGGTAVYIILERIALW